MRKSVGYECLSFMLYSKHTFPEHPSAPQLGKQEMLAQHNAQHKINLLSSTASLPMFALFCYKYSTFVTVLLTQSFDFGSVCANGAVEE